jgi:predicted ABC-type ATPase
MVAGPNGSGKTTLVKYLDGTVSLPLGLYLNPDDLDGELGQTGRINLSRWNVQADPDELLRFIQQHPLAPRAGIGLLTIDEQTIVPANPVSTGYLASILSDYLRHRWIASAISFTFETVMSSPDKIGVLAKAKAAGYRTYLYYICTDSPLINRQRVANRVQDGGHDVASDKVTSRYERSLSLLPQAVSLCDRAYLFDNSGQSHILIAEFESGKPVSVVTDLPLWFKRTGI